MLHMVSTHIIPTRNEATSLCARLTSVECPPIRTTHSNPFVDIHSFAARNSNSPIILPAISACDVSHGHFTLLHTLVATTPDSTNTAGINAFFTISPPFPRKFPHATARLFLLHPDFAWISVYPAINSLASAKGPSITARLPAEYRTRQPFELGCNPDASSNTPAFANS